MPVDRIGVSLEPDLLSKFDELIKRKGYKTRSEAIRDLIRDSLVNAEIEEEKGKAYGILTIIYNHNVRGIVDRLIDIQHNHHANVLSTVHVHIDEDNCLEVLILHDEVKEIRKIADRIRALRGIKQGKLALVKC